MADLVGPGDDAGQPGDDETADGPSPATGSVLSGRVTVLRRMHRFAEGSGIAALAEAIRARRRRRRARPARRRADRRRVGQGRRCRGLAEVQQSVVAAGIEVAAAAARRRRRRGPGGRAAHQGPGRHPPGPPGPLRLERSDRDRRRRRRSRHQPGRAGGTPDGRSWSPRNDPAQRGLQRRCRGGDHQRGRDGGGLSWPGRAFASWRRPDSTRSRPGGR